MPLLPAVVPEIPEKRSEVVPARLARKVAPLFGVPWPEGPFGGRTWVSDYAAITLSEIARGAPLPTRAQSARLGDRRGDSWQIIDRVGIAGTTAALPNEIANATLNRFGPDTKAAVVLTAVNRLLEPITAAVEEVLPLLVDRHGTPLPTELRLAAWAGLVVETFRSQPALVAAAIRARTIQRELILRWRLPLSTELSLTRCEIGGGAPNGVAPGDQPHTLDLVDATFAALRVAGCDPDETDPDLTARLLHDETVELLLRRLLATGSPHDAGLLWMTERTPGQLAVEALLPPTNLIAAFVRQAGRALGEDDSPPTVVPAIPDSEQMARLSPLGRRAGLLALLAVLRHVQDSPVGRDRTRGEIVAALDDVAVRARRCLPADDPVAALTACRTADMTVQTLRHDVRHDLHALLAALVAGLDRCIALLHAGVLDRGAAAEAISSACVELGAVRWTSAERAPALVQALQRGWRAFHEALEIQPWTPGADPPSLTAGYHLHNYAAYLASPASPPPDLRTAVELFDQVVIPARRGFFERSGSSRPLRHSLQVASRATTQLGESARESGDPDAAAAWATRGLGWIRCALSLDETRRFLATDPPTENACRLALLAAPALLLAVETGAASHDSDDAAATAASLIDLARRWEQAAVGDGGLHHARHAEVHVLQERLDALTTTTARTTGSGSCGEQPPSPSPTGQVGDPPADVHP